LPCLEDAVSYVGEDPYHRRRAKRHTLHLQDPKKVLVTSLKPIPGAISSEYVLYIRDTTREHEFNAMKSDFLSTATHELRTPMACILGFAEMLAEGLSTEEDALEHARLIYEQASEMSRTLDDLLDLARMEARRAGALTFRPESAAGIAAALARTWRVAGDPRCIQLQVACDAQVSVSVDPQKIRQALRNLLSNAFKYSTAPSPVRLTVQAVPAGPVVFTVTDEGMGMAPDEVRHAFDRFFRAEATASFKGTGLGLSLVKQIVELHGGAVRLSSAVGEGTVVSVELPQILYARDELPALDFEERGRDAA
jgi:signal transduction histidine kinase